MLEVLLDVLDVQRVVQVRLKAREVVEQDEQADLVILLGGVGAFLDNSGPRGPSSLFFNNLSVTPEPGSAALIVLAGLGLLRRPRS